MGAVAVLHPHDVLKDRLNTHGHHRHRPDSDFVYSYVKSRKNPPPANPSLNPSYKTNSCQKSSNRRKKSPQKNGGRDSGSSPPKAVGGQPMMGQVKILKRGEVLAEKSTFSEHDSAVKKEDLAGERDVDAVGGGSLAADTMLSTTDRLGPEPEMVPKQVRLADLYAGTAFVTSPPPSSLPLPRFFNKKSSSANENDADATIDLRRLLRLDLA